MNGWSDWNAWNVALWISNDQAFYESMQRAVRLNVDLNVAVAALQLDLPSQTPDGADFGFASIKEAIADDHEEYWSCED